MRRFVLATLVVFVAAGGGAALARQLPVTELGSAILSDRAGESPADQQYRPPPGPGSGIERISIMCQAEWNPSTGTTGLYFFAPDTPQIPIGVSGSLPFTGADGTGIFTPSGRMRIFCKGHGWTLGGAFTFTPPFVGKTSCTLYRGGADFSTIGARVYSGQGRLTISASGDVKISCRGAFIGISTGPTTLPTHP